MTKAILNNAIKLQKERRSQFAFVEFERADYGFVIRDGAIILQGWLSAGDWQHLGDYVSGIEAAGSDVHRISALASHNEEIMDMLGDGNPETVIDEDFVARVVEEVADAEKEVRNEE